MPSEPLIGKTRSHRDRSLVIAWWVIGVLAVVEVIVAAVGLAPKAVSSMRNTQPSDELSAPSQPMFSRTAAQPSATRSPDTDPKAVTKQGPRVLADAPTQQETPSVPGLGTDLAEKPLRQPPSDAASPDGAVIEILHADIKGTEGGPKTLQLAIKSRSRETIDVPQVKVQVYFYDEQNGEIVPSKAQVTSKWLSAPVDWKNGKPELLEVCYLSDTADPDVRFAGYVVAIYYKGDLQDCRANPPKLKKLFEPKYFIGLDEP
jgi:hypothetical protein